MILDIEIGEGRDEILALFDGTPLFIMKIVEIGFTEQHATAAP